MCKTKKTHKVRAMITTTHEEDSDSDADVKFAFQVSDSAEDGTLAILINEQPVEMLIDSGTSCNIVTVAKFEQLKSKDIKLEWPEKKVYPFDSKTSLHVKGTFTAGIQAREGSETVPAKIQVIKGAQICLLGRKTAVKLGLPRIGSIAQIHTVQPKESERVVVQPKDSDTAAFTAELQEKYKDCFQGLGKLKDFQLAFHEDNNVKPVTKPVLRIPLSVRKQVKEKLNQLKEVERVNGPTPWMSPHGKKEQRLCVDMC